MNRRNSCQLDGLYKAQRGTAMTLWYWVYIYTQFGSCFYDDNKSHQCMKEKKKQKTPTIRIEGIDDCWTSSSLFVVLDLWRDRGGFMRQNDELPTRIPTVVLLWGRVLAADSPRVYTGIINHIAVYNTEWQCSRRSLALPSSRHSHLSVDTSTRMVPKGGVWRSDKRSISPVITELSLSLS